VNIFFREDVNLIPEALQKFGVHSLENGILNYPLRAWLGTFSD